MPGPGPHMMYTLGSGLGLMSVSNGRFSPHHCLTYSVNAFFGPDIGSFSEWLTSTLGLGSALGYAIEPWIHDPFYYILILGIPMSMLYSTASKFLLKKGLLDSASGVALTRKQCLFLVAAGSLSHFFLDHLFEVPSGIQKRSLHPSRLPSSVDIGKMHLPDLFGLDMNFVLGIQGYVGALFRYRLYYSHL